MAYSDPTRRKQADQRRRKTAEGKAKRAAYNSTPAQRAAQKRYRQTESWRRSQRKSWGLPEPTRGVPERCECCNGPPTGQGRLHLDHDHKTGKFRGWLCSKCNQGIGLLGDDALGVRFALAYLSLNG